VLPLAFIVVGVGVGALAAWHRYRLETTTVAVPAAVAGPGARADGRHPDDDGLWLGGFIYNNPADKRVFVPKRLGLGLTVNWGTAGGKALYAIIVLLIVAAPLASLLSK